ncbi:hypothetical protein BDV95DRAFT_584609 [Massariosphaeria phaeospora]|uniref:Uncharacterized protein n=1 Tax=Massariosphaeria phaeospora TaxID=100035 RepID=A0A7C8I2I1_9PLEO|nr:hypothetical protein BDV95DRAFT_584609 [Massariosphaeria phaeospora]
MSRRCIVQTPGIVCMFDSLYTRFQSDGSSHLLEALPSPDDLQWIPQSVIDGTPEALVIGSTDGEQVIAIMTGGIGAALWKLRIFTKPPDSWLLSAITVEDCLDNTFRQPFEYLLEGGTDVNRRLTQLIKYYFHERGHVDCNRSGNVEDFIYRYRLTIATVWKGIHAPQVGVETEQAEQDLSLAKDEESTLLESNSNAMRVGAAVNTSSELSDLPDSSLDITTDDASDNWLDKQSNSRDTSSNFPRSQLGNVLDREKDPRDSAPISTIENVLDSKSNRTPPATPDNSLDEILNRSGTSSQNRSVPTPVNRLQKDPTSDYSKLKSYLAECHCLYLLDNLPRVDELHFEDQHTIPNAQSKCLWIGQHKETKASVWAYMRLSGKSHEIVYYTGAYKRPASELSRRRLIHPFNKVYSSQSGIDQSAQARLNVLVRWYFISSDMLSSRSLVLAETKDFPSRLRNCLDYIASKMGPAAAKPPSESDEEDAAGPVDDDAEPNHSSALRSLDESHIQSALSHDSSPIKGKLRSGAHQQETPESVPESAPGPRDFTTDSDVGDVDFRRLTGDPAIKEQELTSDINAMLDMRSILNEQLERLNEDLESRLEERRKIRRRLE